MAVDLSTIFTQKVREFRQSNAVERFTADFIDAANKVVHELSLYSYPSTQIASVSGSADSIDISDDYYYVVSDGISYFLALNGQKPQDGITIQGLRAAWEDQRGNYNMGLINTLQSVATNSVAGLGAVGVNASS